MSTEPAAVAAARIEAERARGRMMDTARELQDRVSPATLAQNAWTGAKSKGADLAEEAVDAVRARPAIASGVVAAIALFLAREPLIDLAGKLTKGIKTKRKPRPSPGASKPAAQTIQKTTRRSNYRPNRDSDSDPASAPGDRAYDDALDALPMSAAGDRRDRRSAAIAVAAALPRARAGRPPPPNRDRDRLLPRPPTAGGPARRGAAPRPVLAPRRLGLTAKGRRDPALIFDGAGDAARNSADAALMLPRTR